MLRENLYKKLNYQKAYRASRQAAANWILANPESFEMLLDYCQDESTELSYKAAWAFEFVCKDRLSLLLPHLDRFCSMLPSITKDQAKRPFAKVTEILCLEYYKKMNPEVRESLNLKHRTALTEMCFDWLINEEKVACKAYSIQSLYWLGTEFDWVHPELKIILEEGYSKHSAAFKARAREFIAKIDKFEAKQG